MPTRTKTPKIPTELDGLLRAAEAGKGDYAASRIALDWLRENADEVRANKLASRCFRQGGEVGQWVAKYIRQHFAALALHADLAGIEPWQVSGVSLDPHIRLTAH